MNPWVGGKLRRVAGYRSNGTALPCISYRLWDGFGFRGHGARLGRSNPSCRLSLPRRPSAENWFVCYNIALFAWALNSAAIRPAPKPAGTKGTAPNGVLHGGNNPNKSPFRATARHLHQSV